MDVEGWDEEDVADLCVDEVVAGFLCVWGALAELRAELYMSAETNPNGLAAFCLQLNRIGNVKERFLLVSLMK